MLRSTVSKVMWVGRATVFFVGLTVILALLFGVVSTAFAGNGDPFKLGRKNTASKVSKLVKSGVGPALQLEVGSGPPLGVNSSEKVTSLNSDLLDGKDSAAFVANSTYRVGQGDERAGNALGDGTSVLSQSCLPGDRLLSGGPASVNVNSDVLDSFASDTITWQARIALNGQADNFTVVIICADQ
jgi:hypothetical protein